MAIQHRHTQRDARALPTCRFILPQHGTLAVELSLAVEVRGPRLGVGLVGCVSWYAGENVVGGDVNEEDIPRGG
jgi:hypothetical protein